MDDEVLFADGSRIQLVNLNRSDLVLCQVLSTYLGIHRIKLIPQGGSTPEMVSKGEHLSTKQLDRQ